MATDPRKRQKKLERRNAKRHEKKHQIVKARNAGMGERLEAATKYPILHSSISEVLWEEGIGWVLLSRQLPDGSVALAVFLVDRWCLGVKDAIAQVVGHYTYEKEFLRKMQSQSAWRQVSPATARKFVEAAVAYAASFGFAPHADYHKAKHIFGAINPAESTEELEFGKDGKPFFFAGPNDTPERSRQILAALAHKCGPDGFHYVIPMVGSDRFLPNVLIGEDEGGEFIDEEDYDEEP